MSKSFFIDNNGTDLPTPSFPKSTVVILGDSITAFNGYGDDLIYNAANFYCMSSFGYLTWANILLGQRLKMVKNAGIPGNTTAQILARIGTDVLAYKSGYCIVLAGTNDIIQNVDIEVIKSNLLSIYTTLINNGISVIAGTIPPNGSISTAYKAKIIEANNYIKSLRSVLKNFILCDWHEDLVDPVNGNYKTNLGQSDLVHPTVQGAYKMGYKLYSVLQNLIPVVSVFSGSNVNDTKNPLSNPFLLGGTTMAPFWSTYAPAATITETKVARVAGSGLEWAQVSNSAAATSINVSQVVTAGFAVGQKVSAYIEFEIDAGATLIDNYSGVLAVQDASNVILANSYSLVMSGATETTTRFGQDKVSGILYIPRFTIPALSTKLYLQFTSKQVGAFRVGRTRVILE